MAWNGPTFGVAVATTSAQNAELKTFNRTKARKLCTQSRQVVAEHPITKDNVAGPGQARKIWGSALMMKSASASDRPDARNFSQACSIVAASTEKITSRLCRPMK